ncbi:MAG: hypothetical protein ACLVJ6_01150 [Merdibacter sp.]
MGYRIERVLLAIPSLEVTRCNQKINVSIEDGTRTIRLFHIQSGATKRSVIALAAIWSW